MDFYDFDLESGNFPLYLNGTLGTKVIETIKKHFEFDNIIDNIDLNNYIIIRFLDDNKVYVLHKYIYDKFPNSIFAATKRFENKNEITLQNISYEQFLPVYEYLIGKQYDVSHKDIFEYLGIINIDFMNLYNKILDKEYTQKIIEFNNFMNSNGNAKEIKLLLIKSYDEYLNYKNIIKDAKNIIPIQFMKISADNNPIGHYGTIYMSIYDCVPIYVFDNFIDDEIIASATNENGELNIGIIRIKMLKMFINELINEEKDNDDDPDYVNRYNEGLDSYINGVCTNELHDFVNNINTKNDHTYLKFIMNTYSWVLKTHYNYFNGSYTHIDQYKNNKINENKICNSEFLINDNKITTCLNFLTKNNILKKINSLDYDKEVSYKKYTSGTFNYYLCACNIYFGFINTS